MTKFYIPDNVNLDFLVVEYKRPDVRKNLIFGCAYILNHFHNYPLTPKGKDIYENTRGGVPISMVTLRENIGSKTADKSLKLLLNSGVISILKNYIPGLHISRVYVLNKLPFNWIKIVVSKSEKKLGSNKSNLISQDLTFNSLDYLSKWLSPQNIEIDFSSLDFFIQYFYNKIYFEIFNIKTSYRGTKKKEYINKIHSLLNGRFKEITNSFLDFNSKINSFSRSETNGRYHTSLTQMSKMGRYFLSHNNEHLSEVDLNASQPFFLLFLLKEILKIMKKKRGRYEENLSSNISLNLLPLSIPPLLNIDHMLSTFSDLEIVQLEEEIEVFRKLFESNEGEFYSNLSNHLNSTSNPKLSQFSDRNRTKKAFMHILFDQFDGKKKSIPTYQVFVKAFPAVGVLLDSIKEIEKNRLAIILQRLESHFILDVIALKFSMKFPDIPFYTIHDAFLTIPPRVVDLNNLIKNELKGIVGISPSIKVKELSPESLFNNLDKTLVKEISLLKEKSRKKKPLELSDYKFFKLFENEVPRWKNEEVMTISVWSQVKGNSNYKPFLIDASKMKAMKAIDPKKKKVPTATLR